MSWPDARGSRIIGRLDQNTTPESFCMAFCRTVPPVGERASGIAMMYGERWRESRGEKTVNEDDQHLSVGSAKGDRVEDQVRPCICLSHNGCIFRMVCMDFERARNGYAAVDLIYVQFEGYVQSSEALHIYMTVSLALLPPLDLLLVVCQIILSAFPFKHVFVSQTPRRV